MLPEQEWDTAAASNTAALCVTGLPPPTVVMQHRTMEWN